MRHSYRWLLAIFVLYLPTLLIGSPQFLSTESDPDAFIQNSVNTINGDYCESATDLVITGPDALILQRFYSTKDVIAGTEAGGWRIYPQRFLVIGKDPSEKSCTVGKDQFEWTSAFTGERSGEILPFIFIKKLVQKSFIIEPNGGGILYRDSIELVLKEKKTQSLLLLPIPGQQLLIMNS